VIDLHDPAAPRPKILSVIGARPEIVQAARVSAALRDVADEILVHTGQHYDALMSSTQIVATGLPEPDYNLGVGSGSAEEQLSRGQEGLLEIMRDERPDAVLVRGDTNATLAGARAAVEAGIPLVHVEAGLRSYRDDMPEEFNRIQTDRLSALLLAPTERAAQTLADEGVGGEIRVVGDPLCDMLESLREEVRAETGDYVLATIHRNYNTDDPARLQSVLDCLARSPWPVVLPLHPRTRAQLDATDIVVPEHVAITQPVTYTRMLELERGARRIATDSGGVQREAYLWGVPCLTLREETEWVETVETGWNHLVGVDPDRFEAALHAEVPAERPPVFGDGHSSERIAAAVCEFVGAAAGAAVGGAA